MNAWKMLISAVKKKDCVSTKRTKVSTARVFLDSRNVKKLQEAKFTAGTLMNAIKT